MKERWRPVLLLAGGLFLVNVIARLVVRIAAGSDDAKQVTIGLWALIAVGVVLIPIAYWWSTRYLLPRVVADLLIAILLACVLAVLVGPLVSGTSPFSDGVGLVFRQFFYFVAVSAGGVVFGMLAVMTVGKDYKSQAWKRYAERVNAKPRKIVRR
jgi:hypothetical protein